MADTGSTQIPLKKVYREKQKIIGLFLRFGHISYVTKQDKIKKQIIDKTFKAILVGCADNHIGDTSKL